jgi:hypothetical protein
LAERILAHRIQALRWHLFVYSSRCSNRQALASGVYRDVSLVLVHNDEQTSKILCRRGLGTVPKTHFRRKIVEHMIFWLRENIPVTAPTAIPCTRIGHAGFLEWE